MGRFFFLLWQKTLTLVKSSPLVFAIFMLVQVVTAFSYIFFYSTVVKSRADYVSAYGGMRNISVTVKSGSYSAGYVKKIINNGVAKPDDILFNFSAGGGANPKQIEAYLYPEINSGDVTGSGITDGDVDKKSLVIIPANMDKSQDVDPTHNEKHKVGDKVNVAGLKFFAKGVRYGGWLDEIPYTTGLTRFQMTEYDIYLPAGLSDIEKQRIGDYCTRELGATSVALPKPMAQKVFTSLFLPLIASAFIGVIAILNFIFLYRYMLERCRRDYTLLRLCGSSRKKSLALLFCQLAAMFTASYLFSLIAMALLKAAFGAAFKSVSLDAAGCAAIYATFLLLILLLMLPVGRRFFKKSIIDDEKLLS